MKRKNVLKQIVTVLKNWEGSQMSTAAANEILTKLEKLGMKPPEYKVERPWPEADRVVYGEWENEKK